MNLRRLAIFLCIVIAIIAWALLSPGTPARVAKAGPSANPATIPPGESAPDINQPPLSKAAWDRIRSSDPVNSLKPTLADCERFLAKHGETPTNLLAVFEKTDDRKWLERALVAFPDSPVVLLSALTDSPDATAEERAAWLEKFKAAEPNNPLPWIIAAAAQFKNKQPVKAMEEASAALDRPAFYTYNAERTVAARALYEETGLHPMEAELLASVGLKQSLLTTAMALSRALETHKTTDIAAAAEAGRIQYGIGRMFHTPEASRLLIGQLVAVALETKGLTSRSADFQERRKTELEAEKAEILTLIETAKQLATTSNDQQLAEYLRHLRTEGELSALRWLKSQQK